MRPLVGVFMVVGGLFVAFGGATGRLAPMLAALFAPDYLAPGGGNPNVGHDIGQAVVDAGNAITWGTPPAVTPAAPSPNAQRVTGGAS